MRTFNLVRKEDVSGVSGTGIVAEGVQLHTGQCVLCWFGRLNAIEITESIDTVTAIHGHEGRTKVEWLE